VLGPPNASVTLIVFSDFQCPYCAQFESTLEELVDRYSDDLRIVWKDYPLEMHPQAFPAALLGREAYAKGNNGSFWEVHEDLFDAQSDFGAGALEEIALEHDLAWPPEQHLATLVDHSLEQGRNIGVRSTPTCFVNGRAVVGSQPLEAYATLVDDALAKLRATRPKAP
jgi:protein-disulfide isomerase